MSKVTSPKFWSDLVSLRPRFQRSAHLERDFHGVEWLRGYVVTPLARSILSRVVGGLATGRTSRAWSLTGPYGTGKSAFALFLSRALAAGAESELARKLLKESDPELYKKLFGKGGILPSDFGLHPVLATGQPRRVEAVLLDALVASLEAFWPGGGTKPEILQEVADAAKRVKKGEFPSPKEVVELFEKSAKQVAASKRSGRGLLIILDEAGRVLELAARGVSHGDVHLLQELAEAASRSEDVPIVFVVMLHQAFDEYASRLSSAKRTEWAKIQGRFEDIPFQESSDQVVRLVGAALQREKLSPALAKRVEAECAKLEDLLPDKADDDFPELLAAVAPLHPLAVLALGPLFRSRLAQNERSLFAFLGSSEPHGFRQHLEATECTGGIPYYRLDQLYDYVVAAFGGRIYGQQGHTWALVETCIRRLPKGAERLDERVLKVIGLLGMFGEQMGGASLLARSRSTKLNDRELPRLESDRQRGHQRLERVVEDDRGRIVGDEQRVGPCSYNGCRGAVVTPLSVGSVMSSSAPSASITENELAVSQLVERSMWKLHLRCIVNWRRERYSLSVRTKRFIRYCSESTARISDTASETSADSNSQLRLVCVGSELSECQCGAVSSSFAAETP